MQNKQVGRRPPWRRAAAFSGLAVTATIIWFGFEFVAREMRTSAIQARHFSQAARQMSFGVEPGPSASIRFPSGGPFDQRFGYTRIPEFVARLRAQRFEVEAQARLSPELVSFIDRGYYPPYAEKTQAGLRILDCRGDVLHASAYPERRWERFTDVPPVVVRTLLFIENRELLDAEYPRRNPAVEWDRLAAAALSQAAKLLDPERDAPGGSTLATQIEKFRHSPEGITSSAREKFRQMLSASYRAYRDSDQTLDHRRQVIVDYLNTVPLSATAGFGEVNGIGDGLLAFYGADLDAVSRVLAEEAPRGEDAAQQARAFRQVLSLIVAQRRPSFFLGSGREQLHGLTDSYLRLLARAGIIAPWLRDAALRETVSLRRDAFVPNADEPAMRKAANAVRVNLADSLGLARMYELDRLDLSAASTIDGKLQRAVSGALRSLHSGEAARAAGLGEHRLLEDGDPAAVRYSFTLHERGEGANLVRVQTDSLNLPFDFNEGSKLELGSTAKLRTLVSYLEVVARLHERLAGMSPAELRALQPDPKDRLGVWAVEYLSSGAPRELAAMLEAAMERRYSASPAESFFTGGGLHRFENFKREDDSAVPTVREAFTRSINLPFVRIMRDIVNHHVYGEQGDTRDLLGDAAHPRRDELLGEFADREGRQFLRRFHGKYRSGTREAHLDTLMKRVRPTDTRLAAIFRSIEPAGDPAAFAAFMRRYGRGESLSQAALEALYARHDPERLSLSDRGYLARVHPLELWLLAFLKDHPGATLGEVFRASVRERQEVYGWLFKTRRKAAQDRRILSMLEEDAFEQIHQDWRRVGFPFEFLVPSYATAIGSSGDRPAALAELMGILLNDGVRQPVLRVEGMRFASGTPYDTALRRVVQDGERVMSAEVAAVVRQALMRVVEQGTARRLAGAFDLPGAAPLAAGGKTGTGDNRFETYSVQGGLAGSRVLNRTATFVFFLGDRHYGVITAYVPGAAAGSYDFTSALPVQILKFLAPLLNPAVHGTAPCAPSPARPRVVVAQDAVPRVSLRIQ